VVFLASEPDDAADAELDNLCAVTARRRLVSACREPGGWGTHDGAAVRERVEARLAAAGARPVLQIGYWQANGGVTYQDPDGREVMFASWI
jgi:hypothetical protein